MEGLVRVFRATKLENLMSYRNATAGYGDDQQRVGPLLAIGIFAIPVVFVWLLLRPGYSIGARLAGFAWLLAMVAVGAVGALGVKAPAATSVPQPAPIVAPMTAKVEPPMRDVETDADRRADEINQRIDASMPGAREAVYGLLKDSESARFRDVWAIQPSETKGVVFCGEVNARNGLGAYNGYERFFAVGHRAWVEANSDGFFSQLYSEACDDGARLAPVNFK
jgi:hypothetical protein